MESKIDTLTKRMQELIESMKEHRDIVDKAVAANNAVLQEISNEISLKLDMMNNGEASQKKPSKKIKTKETYFKDMLKEDINVFVDKLYSQEDIQRLMENPEVLSRKNEANKISKLGGILFKEISKDAARTAALAELYSQYKNADE